MNNHIDKGFPDDIAGVMRSWPGRVLSVRLAHCIHDGEFKTWRDIFDNYAALAEIDGVGAVLISEVAELFGVIGMGFEAPPKKRKRRKKKAGTKTAS